MLFTPRAKPMDRLTGAIGLPRVMFFHELMLSSEPSGRPGLRNGHQRKIQQKTDPQGKRSRGQRTVLPQQGQPRHLLDLVDKGVQGIFLPSVATCAQSDGLRQRGLPLLPEPDLPPSIRHQLQELGVEIIQGPSISIRDKVLTRSCCPSRKDGHPAGEVKKASSSAEATENFYRRLLERSRDVVSTWGRTAGHGRGLPPLQGFDPGINLTFRQAA
jgi:hypothetical protein